MTWRLSPWVIGAAARPTAKSRCLPPSVSPSPFSRSRLFRCASAPSWLGPAPESWLGPAPEYAHVCQCQRVLHVKYKGVGLPLLPARVCQCQRVLDVKCSVLLACLYSPLNARGVSVLPLCAAHPLHRTPCRTALPHGPAALSCLTAHARISERGRKHAQSGGIDGCRRDGCARV